jgi:hypothetical protein
MKPIHKIALMLLIPAALASAGFGFLHSDLFAADENRQLERLLK